MTCNDCGLSRDHFRRFLCDVLLFLHAARFPGTGVPCMYVTSLPIGSLFSCHLSSALVAVWLRLEKKVIISILPLRKNIFFHFFGVLKQLVVVVHVPTQPSGCRQRQVLVLTE